MTAPDWSGVAVDRCGDLADGASTFEVTGKLRIPLKTSACVSESDGQPCCVDAEDVAKTEVRSSGNETLVDGATGNNRIQTLAQAICGPPAGEPLTAVPASVRTRRERQETVPATDVFPPPSHSGPV